MRGLAWILALTATSAWGAGPTPGHYAATLCVATTAPTLPSCGAARLEVRSGGRMKVQVADIVYRLQLGREQMDVRTLQGRMQIDEFSTAYAWQDGALLFEDGDKNVRYRVKVERQMPVAR